MSELARTALAIEKKLLTQFDRWMAEHGYTNRSQAVRDLIRNVLVEQQWARPRETVLAVLSLIYDHGRRELARELTDLQHEDHEAILCSQHVHLDSDRCLETILMRGTAGQLRRIADTIVATRGIRLGKLTLLSGRV